MKHAWCKVIIFYLNSSMLRRSAEPACTSPSRLHMEVSIALVLNLKINTFSELKARRREVRKFDPMQIYALCEYVWIRMPFVFVDFWRPWYEVYLEYNLDHWLEERLEWERATESIFKALHRLTREDKAIISNIVITRFLPNELVPLVPSISQSLVSLSSSNGSSTLVRDRVTRARHSSRRSQRNGKIALLSEPPHTPEDQQMPLLSLTAQAGLFSSPADPQILLKDCSPNREAFKHTPLRIRLHPQKQ